jgi:hypothetical protein
MLCIKCGRPVTVRDSWELYSGEALVERQKCPETRYTAECGKLPANCGWAMGASEEEALEAYAKSQEWGVERLKAVENSLQTLLDMLRGE